MPKILFLTTAHNHDDDRIFYHQATELVKKGFEVKICSLYSDFKGTVQGVDIESFDILKSSSGFKINKFREICNSYQPDCIICSEPIAILAAHHFKKQKDVCIVYDITEWYPAMSMLEQYSFLLKLFHGIRFFLIQLYAGFLATHFIFGEETKKFPFVYFYPFKKNITLPYYPDEKFIAQNINSLNKNQITLCYTGAISEDKGIGNFFKAINTFQNRNPQINTNVLIIGSARKEGDEAYFKGLLSQYSFKNIEIRKPTFFEKFTESFSDADLCFDLRAFNFENHHSLPIKLFYYMGAGKPVIYSDLKGIRKHLDVTDFGFLVNPQDSDHISDCIEKYIKNPELYKAHADNAAIKFNQKYNWNVIKQSFVNFITQSLPKSKK